MKKYLLILIMISLSLELATHYPSNFSIPYLQFLLPKMYIPEAKLITFIAIAFAIYWTVQEFKKNNTRNDVRLEFYNRMCQFAMKKNAVVCSNLIAEYGDLINPEKDIYYINHALVIKKGNTTIDGNYQPDGYVLDMGKSRYKFLYFLQSFFTILQRNIFPEIVLCVINLTFSIIYLVEFFNWFV